MQISIQAYSSRSTIKRARRGTEFPRDQLPLVPFRSESFQSSTTKDARGAPTSFYGRVGRKVLTDRTLFAGFVVAAVLHAVGHAATSLAAGLLGGALSLGLKSNVSTLEVVWKPETLAWVGLLATGTKGLGASLGA